MREPDIDLGCSSAMHEGLWHILPPFRPSVSPLHRVLVSSGESKSFFVLSLPLLVMREVGVAGELLFILIWGVGDVGVKSEVT